MGKPSSTYDVVIIGGGPAGVTAAVTLHRAGLRVGVFERTQFPRFVIGESLLPRCMDLLEEIDLLKPIEEQGFMVKHGAVFLRDDERCCFDFDDQHTKGFSYTWQVPRAKFDEVLAAGAEKQGVPFFFEHTVTAAEVGASPRVTVQTPDGVEQTIQSKFIIDASGYGRVLPRLLDLNMPSDLPVRSSLFTHVKGDRRPADKKDEGRIWIVLHRKDVWFWIIPFSDGITSFGVVGPSSFFAEYGEDRAQCLRAILESSAVAMERLGDVEFTFEPRLIEGYSISVKQLFGEGYCLVGNSTEFLDPVFSAGVTLAMESGRQAAKLVASQLKGERVDWQKDYADHMVSGIETFRTYINAWYDGTLPSVFFSKDPNPSVKRQICSVLAGYAWDQSNPFVREHKGKMAQLAKVVASPPM